jgi:hypothetical protein
MPQAQVPSLTPRLLARSLTSSTDALDRTRADRPKHVGAGHPRPRTPRPVSTLTEPVFESTGRPGGRCHQARGVAPRACCTESGDLGSDGNGDGNDDYQPLPSAHVGNRPRTGGSPGPGHLPRLKSGRSGVRPIPTTTTPDESNRAFTPGGVIGCAASRFAAAVLAICRRCSFASNYVPGRPGPAGGMDWSSGRFG